MRPRLYRSRSELAMPLERRDRAIPRERSELSIPLERSESPTNRSINSAASSPLHRLSKRLSMPQIIPVPTSPSLETVSSSPWQRDEARMTEQFERMMERFQLRLVTHPRTVSSHSQASIRPLSTRRGSGSPLQNHGDAATAARATSEASEPTAVEQSKKRSGPWPATGTVSLVRTAAITFAALVHLLLFPMRLAYRRMDPLIETNAVTFDIVADQTFLTSIVILCNTATYTSRGQLVTTRRAIFRQYRRDGFLVDVLACLPLEVLSTNLAWWYVLGLLARLILRITVAQRQQRHFLRMCTQTTTTSGLKWLDWLLYSRFAHLVRIGRLVFRVCLLTHYMACVWTHLCLDDRHRTGASVIAVHLHSIYDVLQLLQGQGIETTTVAQDVFASCAVLLGSIFLAVMFGHVAILIGNFSANQTAYQRKIESVFAIMEKLQLPQAIRDRVHQYYGYLHTEYESLDGEVVKFAKDLSHTLELEVVLYKYMDVVMNVPHWIDCSPDFQKQLVLNVTIRVYMPDDFVIRCGEVETSCFIVNRGICKQYQLPGSNDDVPTVPLHDDHTMYLEVNRVKRPSELKYLVRDDLPSLDSARQTDAHPVYVTRGHTIGERALIDNYVRTTDVRAFTYVEMCVLEREPFQRMLTRYPEDREMVLTSIVRQWVYQQGTESPVMELVRLVSPSATLDEAVTMVVDTMSPELRDPTISFGGTDHLDERLRRRIGTSVCSMEDRMEQLQAQLNRMERTLETLVGRDTRAPHNGDSRPMLVPQDPSTSDSGFRAAVATATSDTERFASLPRRRQSPSVRRGSSSALEMPRSLTTATVTATGTHTPYADRLFHRAGSASHLALERLVEPPIPTK